MLLFFMAIAQMNWGKLKYLLEDEKMIEFSNSLNKVYSLAEDHPGFIWRISDREAEFQLSEIGFDKFISSTISVWKNIEALKDYTYNSLHGMYLKRSSEWFEKIEEPRLVIWNVEYNYKPTFKESFDRLEYLKINGPSDFAYGWKGHR